MLPHHKLMDVVEIVVAICCTLLLTVLAYIARDWHIFATALMCGALTAMIYRRQTQERKE